MTYLIIILVKKYSHINNFNSILLFIMIFFNFYFHGFFEIVQYIIFQYLYPDTFYKKNLIYVRYYCSLNIFYCFENTFWLYPTNLSSENKIIFKLWSFSHHDYLTDIYDANKHFFNNKIVFVNNR